MARWSILTLVAILLATAPPARGETEAYQDSDAPAVAAAQRIPLAEAAERLALRPLLDEVISHVKNNPNDFGGVYFDPDGTLVIALAVKGASDALASALKLVPQKTKIRWLTVDRSLAELAGVRDELLRRIPDLARDGKRVTYIRVDVLRNRVEVAVAGPSEDANLELRAEFGATVDVRSNEAAVPQVCSSRQTCYPMRGGIQISRPGGLCTYGFNARKADGTALRMITAGHCGNGTWSHDLTQIGVTAFNNLDGVLSSLGDVQRVPQTITGTRNLIYVKDTVMARSITSRRTFQAHAVNDSVCRSGIVQATNYECGVVVDDDFTFGVPWNGEFVYVRGISASAPGGQGDSGGPWFINNTGLGIHSGYVPPPYDVWTYSSLESAETALAVRTCLNAACT